MARRFDNIKVGDQLMCLTHVYGWRGAVDDFKAPAVHLSSAKTYWIVTDLWFDPVRGDRKHQNGEMVAIRRISPRGEILFSKHGHTRRGLASNGYHYADVDYIAQRQLFIAGVESGSVVGIGYGQAIRKRPKIAGRPI